jgi:hypothetical protein
MHLFERPEKCGAKGYKAGREEKFFIGEEQQTEGNGGNDK